jgi:hypothetical protein
LHGGDLSPVQFLAISILLWADAAKEAEERGERLDHALIAAEWRHWAPLLYPLPPSDGLTPEELERAESDEAYTVRFDSVPDVNEAAAILGSLLGNQGGMMVGVPLPGSPAVAPTRSPDGAEANKG